MCEMEERENRELRRDEPERRLGQRCMKCRESSAVLIIRVGDAFCRSCFREYFVHKFRAMLGKNRAVFPGEKVLLAYSGGPSSSAMIQQIREGLSRDAPKKLRFIPAIVFIDEGAVCGQSWEDRERVRWEMESILKATAFPFHVLSLEQLFSLPGSVLQTNLPQREGNYKQAVGRFMGQQRAQTGGGISTGQHRAQTGEGISTGQHRAQTGEGISTGQHREDGISTGQHREDGISTGQHRAQTEDGISTGQHRAQTGDGISTGQHRAQTGDGISTGQHRAQTEDGISDAADRLALIHTADPQSTECSQFPAFSRPPAEHTAALRDLFNSARSLTAKQELLHSLRNHLVLHVARTHGYSKVMSGECCTRLAVRLLSNISLGRGAFLPLDTGFSDNRSGDVVVVRPMREYSLKEISFYNRLFDVPSVFTPALDTKASGNSSIQHLSESFITKLQADFPSTVSTVYRTSEKLHLSRPDGSRQQSQRERCLLCMCTLDTHPGLSSAFSATQVSQQLSEKKSSECVLPAKDSGKQCCSGGQCCQETASTSSVTGTRDFVHLLCYSCRLTIRDLNSADKLPNYILQEAEHRTRRLEMRKEIEEFLLDEDPGDV